MSEMEWEEGKEIPCCPHCLEKGVLGPKYHIFHTSYECQFIKESSHILLIGKSKEEIMKIRREEWESFKAEKKERWLGEVELKEDWIQQARMDTETLYSILKKVSTHWEDEGPQNCYRGMLGENWVHMMMEDLHIQNVTRARPKEGFPFDLRVLPFGTISVKTSPLLKNYVHIKHGEFHSEPTLYLLALKTCSKEKEPFKLKIEEKDYGLYDMKTFKILGYLLGQEVYNLKDGEKPYAENYKAEESDLKDPEEFLDMLLEHSSKKPKETPKAHWTIELRKK